MPLSTRWIPVPASIDKILPYSSESWQFLLKNSLVDVNSTYVFRGRGKYRFHSNEKKALVVFYSILNHCSITDAAEELNGIALMIKKTSHQFKDGRHRRYFPHQTDINEFLRCFGVKRTFSLVQKMLDRQLKDALQMKIIKPRVTVIFDFNEQAYYGKRSDKAICGTNRQKGTQKMRHYMRYMVVSGAVHLFAGSCLIQVGQSKIPIVQESLEHLIQLGFEIDKVLWDREFYRAELIDSVKSIGSQVLMPAKKYKRVRELMNAYLDNKHGRIFHYRFSTNTSNKKGVSTWTWLVITAKTPDTLSAIKTAYRRKQISLEEAAARLYAFMVVRLPHTNLDHWKRNLSSEYKHRWLIEAGFRDTSKLTPRWRTNLDHEREIGEFFRMLVFNAWQITQDFLLKTTSTKRQFRIRTSVDAMRYSLLQNVTTYI